ncbi:MAG: clostripain-related cysteine peptidase [Candidatus Zixiibacteriota bacterium]
MNKTLGIACILLTALLALVTGCSKKKSTKPEPPRYKWTILGYFDGNNAQDQDAGGHSYVTRDLQEMEQIDSTEQVQVVVMLGSSKTLGSCKYYHLQRHLNEPPDSVSSEVLADLGKKDMSNPTTLRDFLDFSVQRYSAEHYMLIIDDHGAGWRGLCSDQVNGDGRWMSLPEFSSALSGFTFEIILFDAPSMALAEVAYQVKDYAEYMIASQFKRYPDNILAGSRWLSGLVSDPSLSPRLFANTITDSIYQAAKDANPSKAVESVLIHLPEIADLATAVSNLGRSLVDSTGPYWSEVWGPWDSSGHVYDYCDSSHVDLQTFARLIQGEPHLKNSIKNSAHTVEALAGTAVLRALVYPEDSRFAGLSIHLPWNEGLFDSTNYAQLDFATTNWQSFVSTFIQTFSISFAGTLDLSSRPTGAKVYLDGVDTGDTTNVIIGGLLPGLYVLKLSRAGYPERTRNFDILARTTTFLFVDLAHGE